MSGTNTTFQPNLDRSIKENKEKERLDTIREETERKNKDLFNNNIENDSNKDQIKEKKDMDRKLVYNLDKQDKEITNKINNNVKDLDEMANDDEFEETLQESY